MERKRVVHAERISAESVDDPPRRSYVEERHTLTQHVPQKPRVKRHGCFKPGAREPECPAARITK